MMPSALTDADQDAGLREEMHYAYGRHQSAGDVGATDYGRVRAAVEPILEENATLRARATAAEAELKAAREERVGTIEAYAALVMRKVEQRLRAEAAEANLIALAKMYGEACGRLHHLGFLMAENVVIEVVEDDEQGRELMAGIEAVTTARDAAEARANAAEDRLRDREAEIERLKIAFHDAIRRPLGVTPGSGAEFYDHRMADQAEERRAEARRARQEPGTGGER